MSIPNPDSLSLLAAMDSTTMPETETPSYSTAWRIQWRMRKRAVVLMFLSLRCQWMMKCYSHNLAPKLLV
ncbi:hypothetical protein E1A91_D12G111500v1 [Gossypium mustelinum]|uniref:Uncharacterized protein n=1 Tax=Gossypium mustelinum TaxID=34275 RepID=A0A5D2SFJ0_GOSMU|nr:hypothetical protein E1A91_D12G111500v1 [Gossypium mustelinum]